MGIKSVLAFYRQYGNIEDDHVTEQEKVVREILFNHVDPLVTIYNDIKLEQLTIAANAPYTPI